MGSTPLPGFWPSVGLILALPRATGPRCTQASECLYMSLLIFVGVGDKATNVCFIVETRLVLSLGIRYDVQAKHVAAARTFRALRGQSIQCAVDRVAEIADCPISNPGKSTRKGKTFQASHGSCFGSGGRSVHLRGRIQPR